MPLVVHQIDDAVWEPPIRQAKDVSVPQSSPNDSTSAQVPDSDVDWATTIAIELPLGENQSPSKTSIHYIPD
jgi:hypothetical protein